MVIVHLGSVYLNMARQSLKTFNIGNILFPCFGMYNNSQLVDTNEDAAVHHQYKAKVI